MISPHVQSNFYVRGAAAERGRELPPPCCPPLSQLSSFPETAIRQKTAVIIGLSKEQHLFYYSPLIQHIL